MLSRYRIVRGKRPPDDPLPDGHRQDTRKHTRHVLRPDAGAVQAFLEAPSSEAWARFAAAYRELLERRFENERAAFDALAELAADDDVFLGCNCPTAKNPDVGRCHTWLALEFFERRYPELEVRFPQRSKPSST